MIFLLDYDGTLVPIVSRPELAAPDAELVALLRDVAARAAVHIVSGRPRDVLDAWLGDLPVALHAEHGLWSRAAGAPWAARFEVDPTWLREADSAMEAVTSAVPGAHVERKTGSLAWHYRNAEDSLALPALARLEEELSPLARARGLDLLHGSRVLELRDARANKGAVAREIATSAAPGSRIVAFGDDTTDEDMFAALHDLAGALTIKVGGAPTIARERVDGPTEARNRLRQLATAAERF